MYIEISVSSCSLQTIGTVVHKHRVWLSANRSTTLNNNMGCIIHELWEPKLKLSYERVWTCFSKKTLSGRLEPLKYFDVHKLFFLTKKTLRIVTAMTLKIWCWVHPSVTYNLAVKGKVKENWSYITEWSLLSDQEVVWGCLYAKQQKSKFAFLAFSQTG